MASAKTSVLVLGLCALAAVGMSGCRRVHTGAEPISVLAVMGGLGDTAGRFAYPRAIDVDPDTQTLWIIDKGTTGRVQQIDARTGDCLTLFRMPEVKNGKPVGVTLAPGEGGEKLLYVPDTHYYRVRVYRPRPTAPAEGRKAPTSFERDETEPELVASFGEYGTGPGQFIYPTDVAVLASADGKHVDRIYVSEYGGNDRVSVFDGEYKFRFSFGTYGADASPANVQFDRPQSIAIVEAMPGQRVLVVTDARNDRVGVFTLDGKLIRWHGITAPGAEGLREGTEHAGKFRVPYGLADLGDGTVLVAEFGNNRVQQIDVLTGESVGIWGHAGREEGELASPWGVAVMGKRAFVLDSGNNRVLAFEAPGRRR